MIDPVFFFGAFRGVEHAASDDDVCFLVLSWNYLDSKWGSFD